MYIKKVYNFDDLKNNSWGDAINTIERIENENKEYALMEFLEGVYFNTIPHVIQINTFLQYNGDDICEALGIYEDDGGA